MRIDTGVKKAIAFRLKFLLEDIVEDYYVSQRNVLLLKTLTVTQRKAMERRFKKEINALKIVIGMCVSPTQRVDLPSWYAIIPEEEQKGPAKTSQAKCYPKPKPKNKDKDSTGQ